MNENLFTKNRGVVYLALVIITIVTFYPLFFPGFGCTDDLQTYIVARQGGIFMNAKFLAQLAGRFYYLFMQPVYTVPFLMDSPFIVKLFHHIPLVTGIILFAWILNKLVRSRELAFLYFLLFLATAQASRHTSLLVTYPFFFTFSFDLLLLSFILLIRYLEYSRTSSLVASVTLFTIGLLFHESYLLYLLFFIGGIVILWYRKEKNISSALKQALITALPFIIVAVAYLATYLIYRGYHPSHYIGTSIDKKHLTLPAFFRALWNLSLTSYPLTAFLENQKLLTERSELTRGYLPIIGHIITTAKVEWIIKGICVALTGFILLSVIRKFSYRVLLAGTGIGILLIFLPHMPLALTEKYLTQTAAGTKGYLTTFFSLFGTVLILSLLLAYLANLFDFNPVVKRIVVVVMAAGLFVCSVITDLNNYYVVKDIRNSNLRLNALDELVKTDSFRALPPNSIILADQLTRTWSYCGAGIIKKGFRWSDYIYVKTKIRHRSYNSYSDIPVSQPGSTDTIYSVYALPAIKTDEILMVMSRLDPKGPADSLPQPYVDQVWVLYYSPYKRFSVSFRMNSEILAQNVVIYVDGNKAKAPQGISAEMVFLNPGNDQAATFFSIRASQIDPASIRITNLVDRFTSAPYYL